MPSKLKLRRQRRLREDVIWWRAEAMDCKARVLELANLLGPAPAACPDAGAGPSQDNQAGGSGHQRTEDLYQL